MDLRLDGGGWGFTVTFAIDYAADEITFNINIISYVHISIFRLFPHLFFTLKVFLSIIIKVREQCTK